MRIAPLVARLIKPAALPQLRDAAAAQGRQAAPEAAAFPEPQGTA